MADEDLRALMRAARTRPDDVAAGWAYARALARAGDPREHDVLVDLARLGDVDAQAALDAWNPWPTPGGNAGRTWRGPAVAHLGAARSITLGRDAYLVGVGRQLVFTRVAQEDALVARGLDDLEVRWRRGPCTLHAMLVGDLIVGTDDGRLLAWDAATGRDVAEAKYRGPIQEVLPVDGGRAIVVAGGRTYGVDLRSSAFGQELFAYAHGRHASFVAGGPWVCVSGSRTEILSVESGEVVRTVSRSDATTLIGADAAGVLASDGGLTALDPRTGETRWRFEHPGRLDRRRLAHDERTVLAGFSGQGQVPSELVALARDTGAVRWRRPLDLHLTMALLPDAVYLARSRRVDHKVLQPWVTLLDPLTGVVRDERELPRVPLRSEPYVAPFPGGLLVVSGDALHVFDGRAPAPAPAAQVVTKATKSKAKAKSKARTAKLARRRGPSS